jgi:dTDP-4-dehydrorhamnose 3,5-epimerase
VRMRTAAAKRQASPSIAPPRRGRLSPEEGFIPGTRKDGQTVSADWQPPQRLLEGVKLVEVRNVIKGRGLLTEVFRSDWRVDGAAVDQVFQVVLGAGEVSAWHVHRSALDRLFVNYGAVRVVLYDVRRGSATFRALNEFRLGLERPALVVVPPGVWHGVQNMRDEPAAVLNLVDRAYDYADPDHWRLPASSHRIPYRFLTRGGGAH